MGARLCLVVTSSGRSAPSYRLRDTSVSRRTDHTTMSTTTSPRQRQPHHANYVRTTPTTTSPCQLRPHHANDNLTTPTTTSSLQRPPQYIHPEAFSKGRALAPSFT